MMVRPIARLPRSVARSLAILVSAIALAGVTIPSASEATVPFFVEPIQTAGFVGPGIALAVDSHGNPHVVYWDVTNFYLMYATRADGMWTTKIIEASVFLGSTLSIAIDAQDAPHVAYHKSTGAGESLRYATRAGGSWSAPEDVDTGGANVGPYCALAIDSQGRPHISYYDQTNGDLKYAVKDGTWSVETVYSTGTVGLFTDLALDAGDRPHISFTSDNNDLYYATRVGSVWYTELIPGGVAVAPTGVAVGPNAVPYVATVASGFLTVLTRDGTAWTTVGGGTVASSAVFDGGIAVDAEDRVHVVYRLTGGGGTGALWYASAGTSWTQERFVQTGGLFDIGEGNDLALDPYGNPVVAYYDQSNGDAMYADSGVKLSTALAGATWPVGSQRTIAWRGAGSVDLLLSTDGGASYAPLATGLSGGASYGGQFTVTVPHRPSRFCRLKIERQSPFAASVSESLFTIETSVSLLSMLAARLPDRPGSAVISWESDPGPEDLAGYRLEKASPSGAWSVLTALTRETTFTDEDAGGAARYRLFAVNGLGEDLLLGEAALRPRFALSAWPTPFRRGSLTVSFATHGGLGGGSGPADVRVFDVHGRRIRTIAQGTYPAGYQSAVWDGRDDRGRAVPTGVYFLRVRSAGVEQALKFTVLR